MQALPIKSKDFTYAFYINYHKEQEGNFLIIHYTAHLINLFLVDFAVEKHIGLEKVN